MSTIALEVSICDQRRGYIARFATEEQALAFIERKSTTHAFHELESEIIPDRFTRLIQHLYPTCPHGLSEANCYGPQHYYYDEEEQARGMRNGW